MLLALYVAGARWIEGRRAVDFTKSSPDPDETAEALYMGRLDSASCAVSIRGQDDRHSQLTKRARLSRESERFTSKGHNRAAVGWSARWRPAS